MEEKLDDVSKSHHIMEILGKNLQVMELNKENIKFAQDVNVRNPIIQLEDK